MSDLIDREALMKEFTIFVRRSNNHDYAPAPTWNDAVSLVGSMPAAEPERTKKVEKVTRVSSVIRTGRCGNCGYDVIDSYKHCPRCGAKLDWGE